MVSEGTTQHLLIELFEAYEDACWQGTGNEPLSSPRWHNCISTYEEADELIPRIREFLGWPARPLTK